MRDYALHEHRDHLHGHHHRGHHHRGRRLHGHRLHGHRLHGHRLRGHRLHGHRHRGHRDHRPFQDKIPYESWLLHEFQRLLPHHDDRQELLPRKHLHSMFHIFHLGVLTDSLMSFRLKALREFEQRLVHRYLNLILLYPPMFQDLDRDKGINLNSEV